MTRWGARLARLRPRSRAVWVAGTYALFGAVWILLSDRLLEQVVSSGTLSDWSIVKGLFFIALTALMLWLLVRRWFGALERTVHSLRAHQAELDRLSRLYSASSQINQAIVSTGDRDELLHTVCRVLIDVGGFKMAWIGWNDEATHLLDPVAVAGATLQEVRALHVSTDERPEGNGPSGLAFRSGRPYICNDRLHDPASERWRAQSESSGLLASASFPVRCQGKVCATLNVYADVVGFFQDQEVRLLTETALDVSFALDHLASQEERRLAQQVADDERSFSDTLIESLPGVLYLYDEQRTFLRWNKNFERVAGYSAAELAELHPTDFFVAEDHARLQERIAEVFENGESSIEAELLASDGSRTPYYLTGTRVMFDGRPCLLGVGIDITERVAAEAAVAASAERFRSTLDSILEACQIVSHDWVFLYLNPSAAQQNRRPNEELLGRTMQEAWPGIEDTTAFAPIARCMRDRVPAHEEVLFEFPDGRFARFDLRVQPVPEGVFILSIDITERHAAELALREANQALLKEIEDGAMAEREIVRQAALLQAVADGTSDALFVKDTEGRYLLFNGAAAAYLGKSVDEVLGRDDRSLVGGDEAELIIANDRWVMRTGQTLNVEEVLTGEGGVHTYLSTKTPYRDADGKVLGIIGISRDVSERKAAEVALRENEARFRTTALQLATVLDHSLDLICSFDHAGRVLRMSAACEQILGYTAEELIGAAYLDFVVEEDHAASRAAAADSIAGLPARTFENRWIRRDGTVRSIEWAAHWSPEEQTMFCVGRDVTEHRQLQAQFLRAQRMESIGTLAGGIAHDFNNILAPITLSIELLRMDVTDPMMLDVLGTIERSARRGAEMVQQLLSFTRGVERDLEEQHLQQLILDVAQILDDTLMKPIQLVTNVAPDLWPVLADSTQLHQVLMNLAVNARDAMEGGGVLTIAADNVLLDEREAMRHGCALAGPYVRLTVADTGSGMSADVLDRVFEPFFTTKDIGKGTGLGLPTSQGIIRSHGGSMELASEEGRGTTVTIFLPASPDAVVLPPTEAAPQLPRGNGELVLLADDEVALRNIAQQMLEAFGYRVLLAADGEEACSLFEQHRAEVAVVISDMMMPNVGGASTIARLREIDPHVRIIVASGVNTQGVVTEAMQSGAEHWLSKPYSTESLLTTLHNVLAAGH